MFTGNVADEIGSVDGGCAWAATVGVVVAVLSWSWRSGASRHFGASLSVGLEFGGG